MISRPAVIPYRRAKLAGSELAGSKLAGSELAGSELAGSELAGSELAGSKLAGSKLADSERSCSSGWTGVTSTEDQAAFGKEWGSVRSLNTYCEVIVLGKGCY